MTNITTYIPYLTEADRMLDYMLDNGDTLTDDELVNKLELMAKLQLIQTKVNAVEKRMREELASDECKLGKSKTDTNKELGFKTVTKRPLDVKLDPEADITDMVTTHGQEAVDAAFPAKRGFSATGLKTLDEELQEKLAAYTFSKPGSLSVKVTKIVQ